MFSKIIFFYEATIIFGDCHDAGVRFRAAVAGKMTATPLPRLLAATCSKLSRLVANTPPGPVVPVTNAEALKASLPSMQTRRELS